MPTFHRNFTRAYRLAYPSQNHLLMKNHSLLLRLSTFVLLLLSASLGQAQAVLEVADFEQKLLQTSNALLLDVRTPDEFGQGHLKGALNVDIRDAVFKQRIANLDKTKPVFVYCLAGSRSAEAVKALQQQGFTEIYDLKGGILKWGAAEKPLEAPTQPSKPMGISEAEWNALIAAEQPVLIDFYAPWCAPCQRIMPMIKRLTEEYKGKAIIKTLNYDQNKALAKRLQVDEIPVFLLYQKGELLWRGIGEMPEKELREQLDRK